MLSYLTNGNMMKLLETVGILSSFIATFLLLKYCNKVLPRDMGREFAHDGKLSQGKPRGAGMIFIMVFSFAVVLFAKMNFEILLYLIFVMASMLTGYLDDGAGIPWGEYKKGLLDLGIALCVALTFLKYNSSTVYINILDISIYIKPVVFIILAIILIWASINVTNCTDGVDGLSGTLAVITLFTIYLISSILNKDVDFNYTILILIGALLAYLWFNANPSKMLMGDAGSRAIGLFISIAILKTSSPFLYIPVALVFIIDGGLGLIKVACRRFLKIEIMKNLRTPIHDHVRQKHQWSNTQVVFRFAIIQVVISFIVIYLMK